MKKTLEAIIWIAIIVTFGRGLFVFDLGGSAADSYPTASAICLTGSIIAAILMLKFKK